LWNDYFYNSSIDSVEFDRPKVIIKLTIVKPPNGAPVAFGLVLDKVRHFDLQSTASTDLILINGSFKDGAKLKALHAEETNCIT
jgi:hypothetical protein